MAGSVDLDNLAEEARNQGNDPPAGWSWTEVQIILWRYRNGLATDSIQRKARPLSADEIERIFEKGRGYFPFAIRAEQLRKRIDRVQHRSNPLQNPGLWKRLVFQYFASDMLPYLQILERTKPAGDVSGYNINLGMINIWISRGEEKLVAYVAEAAI